jgi:tetratricopeptide (TPR) repeat protein
LTGRVTEVALKYQRMLKVNPRHAESLMGMSLVALASGQAEAAVRMATEAVDAVPEASVAWVTLGQALKAAGRRDEAERAYGGALRLDGMSALAHVGLGELKMAAGSPQEAIHDYELALRQQPALAAAHLGLGHAWASMGRNEQALDCYRRTLALKQRLPEAEFAVGFVLARMGRAKEAEIRYRRALMARPDFAAAWMNLGNLLREQGREAWAEAALRRAVELRPDLIAGWLNLALLKREQRLPAEAERFLSKALERNPEQVDTLVAWCQFCVAQGDVDGAWGWLCKAMAGNTGHAEAVNMLGILLHTEGSFEEAVAAFKQAERLGSVAATSNRGNSLLDLGRDGDALRAHEAAVARDPNGAGAAYNLALTRLRLGDWERGWPGYEARWHFREVHRRPRAFRQPRWAGEPLEGRRILLDAEQGLGDTVQFCRFAALVAARGGTAILQVQAPVERLMHSLAVVRSGLAEVALLGEEPPEFDVECPLMSLPAVFRTTPETVPWPGAYLAAGPQLASAKRLDYASLGLGLRVGLAWAGNARYKADRQRSMQLKTLLPLLRTPGVHWISLQKGEAAEQLHHLPGDVLVHDGGSADKDLEETAALVANLDLVVTTDTCIAHLAGALGKPVWILLPHLADWRWMQGIETTPWYPEARLLRQSGAGDWAGVLERVTAGLGAYPANLWGNWPTRIAPQRRPIPIARARVA